MEKHVLSKSTFIRGTQCQKSLWLNKHRRDLKDELSTAQEAIFSTGTNVGELAQKLYPGGVDCSPESFYDWRPSINKTKELIQAGEKVIYEAAFQYDGVMAAIDILVNEDGKWKAYEVKSSSSVKEVYEKDASLQYYVITKSGVELEDISIIHLNTSYIRIGELDLNQLFTTVSVFNMVKTFQSWIKKNIELFKQTLTLDKEPEVKIRSHCSDPYQCDFTGNCWKHIPDYSVFNLTRISKKAWDLYDMGILEIKDIPDDFPLSNAQQIQREGEIYNVRNINKIGITAFLDDLNYPLFHFDFETFMTAVPIFDYSKSYQQLPFQYSVHIQRSAQSKPEHKEHLAMVDGNDPRLNLIKQMIIDLEKQGDILVYNKGFEDGRLKELSNYFPEYSVPIQAIRLRLKDLATPFQKKDYYVKEMKGRYSIKNVLPALVPNLSYKDLEIQEGGTASRTFSEMIQGTFRGDIEEVRHHLLKYCKLDTYAMVKILGKLYEV
jgi:hypothetical protein